MLHSLVDAEKAECFSDRVPDPMGQVTHAVVPIVEVFAARSAGRLIKCIARSSRRQKAFACFSVRGMAARSGSAASSGG